MAKVSALVESLDMSAVEMSWGRAIAVNSQRLSRLCLCDIEQPSTILT